MYMSANFQVISDPAVFQNAQVTIYRAQKVVTMNPQMPWAECVAVAGGTIIAVGDFIEDIQRGSRATGFREFCIER